MLDGSRNVLPSGRITPLFAGQVAGWVNWKVRHDSMLQGRDAFWFDDESWCELEISGNGGMISPSHSQQVPGRVQCG